MIAKCPQKVPGSVIAIAVIHKAIGKDKENRKYHKNLNLMQTDVK